jgi:hypothetical protein
MSNVKMWRREEIKYMFQTTTRHCEERSKNYKQ